MHPRVLLENKHWDETMTTELSSAKYLSPEYLQEPGVDGNTAPPVATEANSTIYSQETPTNAPALRQKPRLTTGLIIVALLLGLFGFSGVVGGSFGALGQVAITNADPATLSKLQTRSGKDTVVYKRTIENLKQFSTVVYFHYGLCFLVGLGFLASSVMLLARKADANSFASTVCLAAIMYNCLTMVVTWLTMPSFKGLKGVPEGAAEFAFYAAIGATAVFVVIKIGIYLGLVAFFSKERVKAVYASA